MLLKFKVIIYIKDYNIKNNNNFLMLKIINFKYFYNYL